MIKTSASISYQVSREILTIVLQGDIVAFKDITKIEGKKDYVSEGISTLAKIATVINDRAVPRIDKTHMYKDGVVEAHANDNIFHDRDKYNSYCIEDPFSYVEEFGLEGFILLKCDFSSHNLYRLNGERLIHPIYFSNCNGLIGSDYFDLQKIIEKLKDWSDIVWTKSKRNDSYLHSTYNGWGLEFRYIPSGEMWEKIKTLDSFMVKEYLKREVFQIMEFAVSDDEDDDN